MADFMPFGKHKGQPFGELPVDYLKWLDGLDDLSAWLRKCVVDELRRRGDKPERKKRRKREKQDRHPNPEPSKNGLVRIEDTINDWYRKLAMKYHPDRGGSHEVMIALNDAVDTLRDRLFASH